MSSKHKDSITFPTPSPSELGPIESWKARVAAELSPVLGLEAEHLVTALEVPTKSQKNGNVRLSVPRLNQFKRFGYKLPKGKPAALASQWAEQVASSDVIERATAESKNNIEVYFRVPSFVQEVVTEVLKEGSTFGEFSFGQGRKILVESSSPNVAKPFHMGHLRSTVIGSYLCNLFRAASYDVTSINYLGDWGKQYGLLAIGYAKYGSEEELTSNPMKHLYDIYVRINKEAKEDESIHDEARTYFKRMEDGDEEALSVWRKMRELSIKELEVSYKRLNVTFDEYSGESLYEKGMVAELAKLKEMGLLVSPPEAKGAQVVDLQKHKLGNVLVVKGDGTTLYLTRDIAAAVDRWERFHFDASFYVVGAPQDLHFRQLFKTLEVMGYEWSSRCRHINFGMVKGMSTRKGTALFLSDILDEARDVMREQMESSSRSKLSEIEDPEGTADIVGVSAVVTQDCNAKRIKDYEFVWSRVQDFNGDTGPYLQYNHARLCGIERKVLDQRGWAVSLEGFDAAHLDDDSSRELASMISQYPAVVYNAIITQEASGIVRYLLDICHAISSANEQLNVLGAEEAQGRARLALFGAARIVLNKGIRIMGLKPLEIM